MRIRASALALVVLLAAACSGSSAKDGVGAAGESLGRIRSGQLSLTFALAATPDAKVGFSMDGSFDLAPGAGGLPKADLTETRFAPAAKVHVVLDGTNAYVVEGSVGYQLADEQVAPLRAASTSSSGAAFTGLDLRAWVKGAATQPPTTLDGEAVDRTTGSVDAVEAINGIVALAGELGGSDAADLAVKSADADRVRKAVTSSSFEVLTGASDRLLRRLTATIELAAQPATTGTPAGASAVLAQLATRGRVTLTLTLAIRQPNSPVRVAAPATVKPIGELPKGP